MEARLTEISQAEALRYLGVRGEPDDALRADAARCADLLRATAIPRVCWRLFPLKEDGSLGNSGFTPGGDDIRRHLAGCGQVILLAATLGTEAEQLIRRAQARDMADAALLDALGSAAIENVCDNLCDDLALRFTPARLTSRFSPGYGDFPLTQQRELCQILNVFRMLGISLTPGGLMIPQKSVTALVGVRDAEVIESDASLTPVSKCRNCPAAEHCLYRKDTQDAACGTADHHGQNSAINIHKEDVPCGKI